MLKPESLRRHLEAADPWVAAHPDRVLTFVDEGSVRTTLTRGLSYEYAYTLNLIFTDFEQHPDTLIVPILLWLRQYQPEMVQNPDLMREGFAFEADILTHQTMDLSIKLQLTERVIVSEVDGQLRATHATEPPLDPYAGVVDDWTIVNVQPETAPDWTVPIPTPV